MVHLDVNFMSRLLNYFQLDYNYRMGKTFSSLLTTSKKEHCCQLHFPMAAKSFCAKKVPTYIGQDFFLL